MWTWLKGATHSWDPSRTSRGYTKKMQEIQNESKLSTSYVNKHKSTTTTSYIIYSHLHIDIKQVINTINNNKSQNKGLR